MKWLLKTRKKNLSFYILSLMAIMIIGCGKYGYEDKLCYRWLPYVAYVRQLHNPERVLVQAYKKGSGFSELLYSETFILDSSSRSHGKDTIIYSPHTVRDNAYSKTPDAYDWKYTDSATGKVVLFTELTVEQNTALIKKGNMDNCYTNYKRWKTNGVLDSPWAHVYSYPTGLMNR